MKRAFALKLIAALASVIAVAAPPACASQARQAASLPQRVAGAVAAATARAGLKDFGTYVWGKAKSLINPLAGGASRAAGSVYRHMPLGVQRSVAATAGVVTGHPYMATLGAVTLTAIYTAYRRWRGNNARPTAEEMEHLTALRDAAATGVSTLTETRRIIAAERNAGNWSQDCSDHVQSLTRGEHINVFRTTPCPPIYTAIVEKFLANYNVAVRSALLTGIADTNEDSITAAINSARQGADELNRIVASFTPAPGGQRVPSQQHGGATRRNSRSANRGSQPSSTSASLAGGPTATAVATL